MTNDSWPELSKKDSENNQPIGTAVGNWLEVRESAECLNGKGPDDTNTLAHLLSGTMIFLAGKVDSISSGIEMSIDQVNSGSAYQKFIDIDLNFTAKSTSGDIFKKTDQAAVKQSIKNLLMTNKLEKPFEEN